MKKVLLSLAAVIGVLALLVLVPTSPALLVDSPETLWSSSVDEWGYPAGLLVTKYAVCIAVGAAIALGMTVLLGRRQGLDAFEGVALALCSGACALVCSHVLFCVLRWSYIFNDLGGNAAYLVQFWQGGYTMYGAILGAMLGMFLYAKGAKKPLLPLLDCLVPGMLVMIVLGRLGEGFTTQGMGSYVAKEALPMLPFVTVDEWGDPSLPVYIYEALASAIALAAMAYHLWRKAPTGRAAETGLTIVSLSQVIFESWRGDELIKFGFVRLNMILAACVLAVIIGTRLYRIIKQEGVRAWSIVRGVIFLAGAGIVIAIEFALDKSTINNTLLYGVMAAVLVTMCVAVLKGDGRRTA